MQFIFVDDTKQKPGSRKHVGNLTALGAVAFSDDQVEPFAEAFWAIYEHYGVPRTPDAEMKWSLDFKRSWFAPEANRKLVPKIRRRMLRAARECGAKAVVVAWDTDAAAKANGKGNEENVLEWLYERLRMMLDNAEERGVVIFDKPGGDHRAEERWLTSSRLLVDAGSDYIPAVATILPILTAPSHHHPHLQLADLVAGSLTAAVQGKHFGLELVPLVRPLLHQNARGYYGGTGLKLYPDSLNNLHHWVLEEDGYVQSGRYHPLPSARFARFQGDDGMRNPAQRPG